MRVVDVLKSARALLEERGWTRGALARDAQGKPLDFIDGLSAAVCFCAIGAVHYAASFSGEDEERAELLAMLTEDQLRLTMGGAISQFNDAPTRTVEEVLTAFDTTIQRLEAP